MEQIGGCDVIDYNHQMIMDGYVLVNQNVQEENAVYFEVRHVKVIPVYDFFERKEKTTCKIKVRSGFKELISSAEEAVEAAKKSLGSKKPKKLLIDTSVISHFSHFKKI